MTGFRSVYSSSFSVPGSFRIEPLHSHAELVPGIVKARAHIFDDRPDSDLYRRQNGLFGAYGAFIRIDRPEIGHAGKNGEDREDTRKESLEKILFVHIQNIQ